MQVLLHRLPCPRDCSLILSILSILAILLQTIAIKDLTDLFSWLRLRSIDIKVFQTFAPCEKNERAVAARRGAIILFILRILAILLQTNNARRKPPHAFFLCIPLLGYDRNPFWFFPLTRNPKLC